jgi:hypothetical protein
MTFWERIANLDKRIIYIVIAISIILPMFLPMYLPVPISKEVKSVYDYINNLTPSDAILLSADYDASTMAELQPMFDAVLRHAFSRHVKVLVMADFAAGAGLAEMALKRIADEYNAINGRDYVFLGFKPNFDIVIQNMGVDIKTAFPTDYYGTPMKDLPMMKKIKNYSDIKLLVTYSGTGIATLWLEYAHERFGLPMAVGCTAVMGPDYYPYLQSGQFVGLLGGLKAAAEYEHLIKKPRLASAGMDAQSWSHIVIILCIIIGNIGYLALRKRRSDAFSN